MDTIVVYSPQNSNRLKYVLDWLLKERLQLAYRITTDRGDVRDLAFFLSYGAPMVNSISVPDAGLLFETGVAKCDPQPTEWKEIPAIFAVAGTECSLPFDLFSALFFLLSRYEEYYPFAQDKHGRYPATSSILHSNGWLLRPLADEWADAFRKRLQKTTGVTIEQRPFLFQPTYDIDMAYSHLYKGAGRIVGAYLRAVLKMDVGQISERIQVLKKKQKDPYDSFRWLKQLHREYDFKPVYFILSAFKTTPFDKNIHPQHPAMMRVTKNLAREGTIGIHPSYYSDQGDTLAREKKILEQVSGIHTRLSRQHYIKIKTPDTYQLLIKNGITDDYSMGYGAYLGFRAGTGSSFAWYDILAETVTSLRIHPFCFMDTTAHFEAKLSASQAFEKLEEMKKRLMQTGSTLVTIFHNFSLGTSAEWKGWRSAYENFLQEQSAGRQTY